MSSAVSRDCDVKQLRSRVRPAVMSTYAVWHRSTWRAENSERMAWNGSYSLGIRDGSWRLRREVSIKKVAPDPGSLSRLASKISIVDVDVSSFAASEFESWPWRRLPAADRRSVVSTWSRSDL